MDDAALPFHGALVRALVQLVQLPLQTLVIFVAVSLVLRLKGRERTMLLWFTGAMVGVLIQRCALLYNGSHVWLALLASGVLPIATSACLLTSLILWWRQRPGSS